MKRKIIFGGTFDPIHYGHLAAAEAALHAYEPNIVLFVPSARPPHKNSEYITGGEHRYQMALLATADNPFFEVSRAELDRPGPSYTIDTARAVLSGLDGGTDAVFIIGADAANEILTWKDAGALLKLCRFAVVTRPGHTAGAEHIETLRGMGARLDMLEIPGVAVSGTDIRARVSDGRPVRYLLPPEVERYIRAHGLYGQTGETDRDNAPFDFDAARLRLERLLSEERFTHTMGVVGEAARLARVYGADEEKARVAALLHDCAKEYPPDKKRALCRLYGIEPDEIAREHIDITHSALGAETARREYGVSDGEILDAIRYHNTGRGNMTLLDKIIDLADYTEPNRDDYPGLAELRALANTDINAALLMAKVNLLGHVKGKGRPLHPNTCEAIKSLKKEKEQ